MKRNYILRPIYDRPEFLKYSLEYEIASRKYNNDKDDYETLFLADFGTTKESLDLVRVYPYKHSIIHRKVQLGLTANIFDGFREAFPKTDSHILILEDDVLVHKYAFKFLQANREIIETENTACVTLYDNFNCLSEATEIKIEQSDGLKSHYTPYSPVLTKTFYEEFPRSSNRGPIEASKPF